MDRPHVAIIMVNWNAKEVTLDCLESLRAVTYPNFSVVIVDNGSVDGSPDAIRAAYPDVTLMEAGKNLGFSGANNVGIMHAMEAGADAVLLLNNDTIVDPGFIEPLVDRLFGDPNVGAVNPKIYYYADPQRIWSAGGTIDRRTGITYQNHIDEMDAGQADVVTEIDYGIGCALLARREAVEAVGLLDDDFFVYYEEAEWCQRIRARGYRILYVPQSRIWHKISLSLANQPERMIYYFSRNRLLFVKRVGAGDRVPAVATDLIRMAASFAVHRKIGQSRAVLRAVKDYCLGRFGEATS